MTKLTPERLEAIRQDVSAHYAKAIHGGVLWPDLIYPKYKAQADLLEHITALEADLEDTRAAYQLTANQLHAHRVGQGTYQGDNR